MTVIESNLMVDSKTNLLVKQVFSSSRLTKKKYCHVKCKGSHCFLLINFQIGRRKRSEN